MVGVWFGMKVLPPLVVSTFRHDVYTIKHSYNRYNTLSAPTYCPCITCSTWKVCRLWASWRWKPGLQLSMILLWFGMKPYPPLIYNSWLGWFRMRTLPPLVDSSFRHGPYTIQHSYKWWKTPSEPNQCPWTTHSPWRGCRFPAPWHWNPGLQLSMIFLWFGMKPCPPLVASLSWYGPYTIHHS